MPRGNSPLEKVLQPGPVPGSGGSLKGPCMYQACPGCSVVSYFLPAVLPKALRISRKHRELAEKPLTHTFKKLGMTNMTSCHKTQGQAGLKIAADRVNEVIKVVQYPFIRM